MSHETSLQYLNPASEARSVHHDTLLHNIHVTHVAHENPYTKKPSVNERNQEIKKTKFQPNTIALSCRTLNSIKMIRSHLHLSDTIEQVLPDDPKKQVNRNIKHKAMRSKPTQAQTKIKTSVKYDSDIEWVGFSPYEPDVHISRFWLQNIQNVDVSDNFLHFRSILDVLHTKKIDFCAFTETRLSTYNAYVNENIQAAFSIHNPDGFISTTNTYIHKDNLQTKQYGGVMSMTNGKLASRYVRTVKEKYGRYQYSDFYGKHYYLRIYVVYRVCQNTESNAGNNTAWVDQKTALQKANESLVDPRKHVTKSLLKDIRDDIKSHRQVLVLGDFNENVCADTGINAMMRKAGLINLITKHLPHTKKVRTYNRGSSIIDGAWSTPVVSDHVSNMSLAPFYTELDSDHRPIIFDLNLKGLLDAREISIKPPSGRRLKFTCPKRVKKYVADVKDKWQHHRITVRLNQIVEYFHQNGKDEFVEKKLTQLDDQIQEILSSAEKRCCKVPTSSKLQWSVQLQRVLVRIRNAKLDIRKMGDAGDHGCGANYKQIMKPLLNELQLARSELRAVKKKDIDLREAHLEERAMQASIENPTLKFDKHLQQLKRIEKQIRDANRVRFTLKGNQEAGVDQLLIPDLSTYTDDERSDPDFDHLNIDVIWKKVNTGNWKKIPKWEVIERQDLVETMSSTFMRKHLAQAQGTPLTSETWDALLKSKKTQKEILDGSFVPPADTPEALQLYLKHLQRPNTISTEFDFHYELEDFKKFIKNAKEKTSSSPSKRHYGHWKTIEKYMPNVFSDLHTILVLVMQYSIMLPRLVTTVMTLLRKEEKPYIHRLRPILLLEVEIQAISSSQWAQKMSKSSEKHHIISNSQYGGRKGRQAQSAVLNKILYYDINNQFVRDYTIIDEDLKANYDRELCTLSALEARKAGAPYEASEFMINFIKSQEFHVKTKYGVSDKSFGYTDDDPIWGLGQGLAWSGESWKAASSTIDQCMKEMCSGMKFVSPDNTMMVTKLMDLYIDDSAQGCNYTTDGKTLLEQTEHNLQLHAQLVYATGGQLALDKCKYYDIRHTFEKGIPRFLNKNEFESVLWVQKDFQSEKEMIKLLNFDETHKTLGYFVCPSGNQADTVKQLSQLAQKWVTRIQSSSLKDFEILLAYETVLLRQWAYRLPGSALTYDQCDQIMKVVEPTLINAMHSQRNISRTLLYASDVYGGMGFKHLYDFAAEEKMKFLAMHIKRNDTTGKLLRISMQATQLQVGTELPFYNLSYDTYSSLCTSTWFTNLWSYIDSRLLKMDMAIGITFQRQRENDKFIMDLLTPHFSSDVLSKINRVRISMKVLTLADIVDNDGRKLLPGVATGLLQRTSTFQWPNQPLYTPWLKYWQQACVILKKYVSQNRLGMWFKTHQKWNWMTNDDLSVLRIGEQYFMKKYVQGRALFLPCSQVDSRNWVQADVDVKKGRPYLIAKVNVPNARHVNKSVATDWSEVFPGLLNHEFDYTDIVAAIEDNDLVAASDGSVQKEKGSAAFCLAQRDGTILFKYSTRVHGDVGDMHSTRTEMVALLGIIVFLRELCRKYRFNVKPVVEVFSDSAMAIKAATEDIYMSIKNVFEDDVDIKTELKWNIKLCSCTLNFTHVKAHQGDDEEINELPLAQQLNRRMDNLAAQAFDDHSCQLENELQVPFLAAQRISFYTPFNRLVYQIPSKINEYKNGHNAEKWLTRTWNVSRSELQLIDWLPYRRAIRKMKREKRYMCVKTVHGQWHTQHRMHQWGQSDTSLCPLCKIHPETTDHVLQCPSETAKTFRTAKLLEFRSLLDKLETHPLLRNRLMSTMLQYTSGFINSYSPTTNDDELTMVNRTFEVQSRIGSRNMFRGLICTQISDLQEEWYKDHKHKKRNNIAKWDVSVRKALIDISNEIWKHRCTIVHEENKVTVEGYTRTAAFDLLHKLKQVPWSLPSASRHLLNRDGEYFKKANIQDVSSWLRRIQYGIQEIEAMEARTSTDIRTWFQNGQELIAASVRNHKKRHKRDRRVIANKNNRHQPQIRKFFAVGTHHMKVQKWLMKRDKNDMYMEKILTNVLDFMEIHMTFQKLFDVCDLICSLLTLTVVN